MVKKKEPSGKKQWLKEKARELRLKKNSPAAENVIWKYLRETKYGKDWKKSVVLIDRYIADFYCPKLKLCLEIDGKSHEEKREYDEERNGLLFEAGIRTIRVPNDFIFRELHPVMLFIIDVMKNKSNKKVYLYTGKEK